MPRESTTHILIVDDEAFIRNAFQLYFESIGYRVSVADGGDAALVIFQRASDPVDVVLLDLVMPGIPGIKLLQKFKELDEAVEVIIATGCGSMNSAIEALRFGAYDYITKPILNFDEDLLRVVRGALSSRRARLTQKLGSALAERGPESSIALAALDFYRALEALSRITGSVIAWDDAVAAVGAHLEKDLGTVAAVAIAEEEDRCSCLARWGAFAKLEDEAELLAQASLWLQVLERHRGWKRLKTGDMPFNLLHFLAGDAAFEALRVPLVFPARGAPVTSGDLFLFRLQGGPSSHSPPDVGLFAMVLGNALSPFREEAVRAR